MIEQAQELEQRGFIVYLLIHETNQQVANHIASIHPNTIIYTDVLELPEMLRQLPLFVNLSPLSFMPFTDGVTSFVDVPSYHWAREFIYDMYRRNLISGRDNGQFAPGEPTRISEFLAMIMRKAVITTNFPPFDAEWHYRYINFGLENHLFCTVFCPNDGIDCTEHCPGIPLEDAMYASRAYISREFAFYLLYNVFFYHSPLWNWNRIRGVLPGDAPFDFVDEAYIYAAYREAIEHLFQVGVVTGRPNHVLAPNDTITRAEVTALLFDLLTPYGTVTTSHYLHVDLISDFTLLDCYERNGEIVTALPGGQYLKNDVFNPYGAVQYRFVAPQDGHYRFKIGTWGYEYVPTSDYVDVYVPGEGYTREYVLERVYGFVLDSTGATTRPHVFLTTIDEDESTAHFELVGRELNMVPDLIWLEAGSLIVVEAWGVGGQGMVMSVERRDAFGLTVRHYFDRGHIERTFSLPDGNAHTNADITVTAEQETAIRNQLHRFDEIASRIFVELLGLRVETDENITRFTSRMDVCRDTRSERYGRVVSYIEWCHTGCINHNHSRCDSNEQYIADCRTGHSTCWARICTLYEHEHTQDCFGYYGERLCPRNHIHTNECWGTTCNPQVHSACVYIRNCDQLHHIHNDSCPRNSQGHLLCGYQQFCSSSCSNSTTFARTILDADGNPSRGAVGSPVSIWVGNRMWSQHRAGNPPSVDRSFIWGHNGRTPWTAIFMLERGREWQRENDIVSVYIHEVAHAVGARDHYCEWYTVRNATYCIGREICSDVECIGSIPEGVIRTPRPASCIMNNSFNHPDIANRESHRIFCEGCINDMAAHLEANEEHFAIMEEEEDESEDIDEEDLS